MLLFPDSTRLGVVSDPTDPNPIRVFQFEYAAGQLIAQTDPLGRVTRYGYDRRGKKIRTTYPDGTIARAGYRH